MELRGSEFIGWLALCTVSSYHFGDRIAVPAPAAVEHVWSSSCRRLQKGADTPWLQAASAACRPTRPLDVASDPATPARVHHAETAPRRRDDHDLGS